MNFNSYLYYYEGSLTQPPCNETVNWYLYRTSLPITSVQINEIESYFSLNSAFDNPKGNIRLLQDINGREIYLINEYCTDDFTIFFSFFIVYIIINYFVYSLI
eukprot:TRINITY_DN23749_c0_g1_i2.p2 TRINITY_DN23749_c0_g1~~TRINITY_DN23749_c0_g1_i2.p2  ORF type:complete len:103 (+),score=12.89 TRINITY_DN23749_c0_g1_i2:190-498(+)